MGEHVIGRSTATLWQCLLSGNNCSSMGQHQWMASGYANCKAPCRRQRPPLSCDTCVGLWGAELALDIKISFFFLTSAAQFVRATAMRTEDLVACTGVTQRE